MFVIQCNWQRKTSKEMDLTWSSTVKWQQLTTWAIAWHWGYGSCCCVKELNIFCDYFCVCIAMRECFLWYSENRICSQGDNNLSVFLHSATRILTMLYLTLYWRTVVDVNHCPQATCSIEVITEMLRCLSFFSPWMWTSYA
jgi:hypothetical protein